MTIGLPNPEGDPTSIRAEFLDVLTEIRNYRAAELTGDVERIIHDVASNSEISGRVIAKIKSEIPACRGKFYRISVRLALMWLALIPLLFIAHLFLRAYVASHTITAGWWIATTLILELYILDYFDWRSEYRDSYIANFLIRSLEFGLRYQSTLTDERLRDGLALMIQRTAIRYSIIYKKSDSTRFFAAQVRRQAKKCRNDIMSLVPGLVVAGRTEIEVINADLTRLLIRTQTGCWHQTSDIARHGMPMPRRNAARIALASFIKDRSIQVAFIALAATITAAVIALLVHAK
jgi:hypothetical protein